MSIPRTIYIGAVVFIMAASAAGLSTKRQSSGKGAGECEEQICAERYTPDFFKMGTNLAGITWAHAVNNKNLLNNALIDKTIMMVEADVIIGTIACDESISPTSPNKPCGTSVLSAKADVPKSLPVMGHPPATTSDLSLESLLADMISHNDEGKLGGPKGLKLDFKTIDAFEASLPILSQYYSKIEFPLWLNADILPGPGENNDRVPVDANRFLEGASNFPASKLSLGWTTKYGKDYADSPPISAPSTVSYSKQQVTDMLSLLATTVNNRNVTFPVRAAIAANSSELMLLLLHERPSYTLTVWSAEKDFVDIANLNALLQQAGNDRFYLDVPKSLADKLKCRQKPKSSSRLLANIGLASAALVAIALFYFNKMSTE